MNLEVVELSKSFDPPRGFFLKSRPKIHALEKMSVSLAPGRSLGIVGESGSGKTTFAKILAGFLRPDSGTARLGEIDLIRASRKTRAHYVQMIFQDPFASLNPKLILSTQIREAFKPGVERLLERSLDLMRDVGLPTDALDRYPHQLSGGQRQRFAIARALAAEPKLLIADEPVSNLDVSVQAQIVQLLNRLRQEKGFSQILISHDLAVISNTCDTVVVMKDGEAIEEGEVNQVLAHPQQLYTQRLLEAHLVV